MAKALKPWPILRPLRVREIWWPRAELNHRHKDIQATEKNYNHSSNQALATHATFQEQRYKGWGESNEGKTSYDMATLPIRRRVGSRLGEDDRQPTVFSRPWRRLDDNLYVASKLDQTVHQSALGNAAEPTA